VNTLRTTDDDGNVYLPWTLASALNATASGSQARSANVLPALV
jgi:hypothetical protein